MPVPTSLRDDVFFPLGLLPDSSRPHCFPSLPPGPPHDPSPLLETPELLAQFCQLPEHPQACPSLRGNGDPLTRDGEQHGGAGAIALPCSLSSSFPPTQKRRGTHRHPVPLLRFLSPGHCLPWKTHSTQPWAFAAAGDSAALSQGRGGLAQRDARTVGSASPTAVHWSL